MIQPSLQQFRREDNRFVVTQKNRNYGKITGTMLAGLLGLSKWSTPFVTTARMLRLYNEDISDKKEVNAGKLLEPKILDYIGAVHGDDIYQERKGDHEDWKSDFTDDIFGGHIDGLMADGTVVEVKTTRNIEDWLSGPPIYYWLQASLYAHFLNSENIIFAVGITDEASLADPESWQPSKHTVVTYTVPVIEGFDNYMAQAMQIYGDTVLKGRTAPITDNPMDVRVSQLIGAQLWEDRDVWAAVDRLQTSQAKLDGMKEIEADITTQKDAFMLYLKSHGLTEKGTPSGTVKVSSYVRNTLDTNALKRDGLYTAYTRPTTIESIRINKKR